MKLQTDIKLIGPFHQLLTMDHLPLRGPIVDETLDIMKQAGILVSDGKIVKVGNFDYMRSSMKSAEQIFTYTEPVVALPGYIDSHTHLCYAGSRAGDYSARIQGKSYTEIAKQGGGIMSSVQATRRASLTDLRERLCIRVGQFAKQGITTIEVKSGYGLNVDAELKMLQAIKSTSEAQSIDLIPTCLAAHTVPTDFVGSKSAYLDYVLREILPEVRSENLAKRVDIFTDDIAFSIEESRQFLEKSRDMGFELVIHADQFTNGGAVLGCELGARSVDHLENSDDAAIQMLGKAPTVATALPGASLGLGMQFAPGRKLLDEGACLAIATDTNPGSAPMGDLIAEASIFSAYEKLSNAEVFAGLTFRAAHALGLHDRGILKSGLLADITIYALDDYREILYHQGSLKPYEVWKNGKKVVHGS